MIITKTPLRISFFGGGSDYPAWYSKHGGKVLAAAIDKFCWISACRAPWFGPKYKLVYHLTEQRDRLEDVKHAAIRECIRYLKVDDRLLIHYWSDLPAYSGMGSSSAFVVGLLHALHALKGERPSQRLLASEATHIERDVLGETVGCQDQMTCAFGGLNVIDFPEGEPLQEPLLRPVFWSDEAFRRCAGALGERLMLFYTGVHRIASDVASSYVGNLEDNADAVRRMIGLVGEAEAVLKDQMTTSFHHRFAWLLGEAWRLKKRLGGWITNQSIDDLCDKALHAGASAVKLLGAGGGGFLLLHASPGKQPAVRDALKGLTEVPFKLESSGSRVVYDGRLA